MRVFRSSAVGKTAAAGLVVTLGLGCLWAPRVPAQASGPAGPMIRSGAAERISEHVYVILDNNVSFVPNVGIVVGDKATLIVDTGLGEANGRIVLEEARGLADNEIFYVTATHFHPEHDLGATAFPATATMVRSSAQQAEADEQGAGMIERFSGFSPAVAGLLADAEFRPPDILFDRAVTIDLGGVRVMAHSVGPNHTLGDTAFWVEGDRVLFTGDVVMSVFPAVGAAADMDRWLGNIDAFEALDPAVIVPAHGRTGDTGLLRRYRAYFTRVGEEVGAHRRAGDSLDATQRAVATVLTDEFSDLAPASGSPAGRINAAVQAYYGAD